MTDATDPLWALLQAKLEAGADCAELLRGLFHSVPVHGFSICKAAIVDIVGSRSPEAMRCAISLVDLIADFWTDTSAPIAYMLLLTLEELATGAIDVPRLLTALMPSTGARLATLVKASLDRTLAADPKVVSKAIAFFQMHDVPTSLVLAYSNGLLQAQEYTSLLKLISEFPSATWNFDVILAALVESSSWSMAEQLVKLGPPQLAAKLVALAVEKHDLKRAHKFVLLYDLQTSFPDVESWFRREALEKLCTQKKWAIASKFVGADGALQVKAALYQYVALAGDTSLADELYDQFQLQVPRLQLPTTGKEGNHGYLRWPLAPEAIVLCDSDLVVAELESHVRDLVEQNQGPVWLGLDVEWRPFTTKNETCLASVLQLACADRVFVVDLIALEGFAVIEALLRDPSVLKIGFGFKHDLHVLKQTFPDMTTFDFVHRILEIDALVRSSMPMYTGRSLSDAAALILGKPLDKAQQMSNWEKRPLTPKQIEYAALDAWVLVAIAERVSHNAEEQYLQLVTTLECDEPSATPTADIVRLRRARRQCKNGTMGLPSHDLGSMETTVNHLIEYVAAHGERLRLVPRSRLSEYASDATTVFANSLCIFADGAPYVAVLPQETKMDLGLLSMVLGTSRKKVRLARPAECISVFGYAPGTVPPVAHSVPAPVLLDTSLEGRDRIVLGGGTPDMLLEASFDALVDLGITSRVVPLSAQVEAQAGPRELKFVADTMLGRVAKWLRMTGVDIVQWDKSDEKSQMLVLATVEHRIVLTRDRKLARQRQALACYVVLSDNVEEQFQEIKKHFQIEFKEETFMSRCAKCNGKGFRIVSLEEAQTRGDVPARVLETVEEFYACHTCTKLYWVGPKYSTAHAKMKEIFHDKFA
ncbi:hypothetical protein ACHHYP_04128 [Achlya hypogyna]|uniref:3'-5' exonuclease domain-containing protein n=1 Tax=Achlya hypogyna TaxID=1202772 RepID=A0A1V9Z1X1_ACHHY|nr:hypothetical protein ACHHYP_04128 [Achlya hypogyna]